VPSALFRITLTCQFVYLNKKTWRNWVTLWSKYFVTFFFAKARTGGWPRNEGWERGSYHQGFMLSQGEGCGEDVRGNGSKHVKGTINHQLQKLKPLRLISWVTLMYFAPWGEGKNGGSNAPGAFLVTPSSGRGLVIPVFFHSFFWWSLTPDLPSVKVILAGSIRSFSVYLPEFSWRLV